MDKFAHDELSIPLTDAVAFFAKMRTPLYDLDKIAEELHAKKVKPTGKIKKFLDNNPDSALAKAVTAKTAAENDYVERATAADVRRAGGFGVALGGVSGGILGGLRSIPGNALGAGAAGAASNLGISTDTKHPILRGAVQGALGGMAGFGAGSLAMGGDPRSQLALAALTGAVHGGISAGDLHTVLKARLASRKGEQLSDQDKRLLFLDKAAAAEKSESELKEEGHKRGVTALSAEATREEGRRGSRFGKAIGSAAGGVGGAVAGHKFIGGASGTIAGLAGGMLAGGRLGEELGSEADIAKNKFRPLKDLDAKTAAMRMQKLAAPPIGLATRALDWAKANPSVAAGAVGAGVGAVGGAAAGGPGHRVSGALGGAAVLGAAGAGGGALYKHLGKAPHVPTPAGPPAAKVPLAGPARAPVDAPMPAPAAPKEFKSTLTPAVPAAKTVSAVQAPAPADPQAAMRAERLAKHKDALEKAKLEQTWAGKQQAAEARRAAAAAPNSTLKRGTLPMVGTPPGVEPQNIYHPANHNALLAQEETRAAAREAARVQAGTAPGIGKAAAYLKLASMRMQKLMRKLADDAAMGTPTPDQEGMPAASPAQELTPSNYLQAEIVGRQAQEAQEQGYYRAQMQAAQQQAAQSQEQLQAAQQQAEQLQAQVDQHSQTIDQVNQQAVQAQDQATEQAQEAANARISAQRMRAAILDLVSKDPSMFSIEQGQPPPGQEQVDVNGQPLQPQASAQVPTVGPEATPEGPAGNAPALKAPPGSMSPAGTANAAGPPAGAAGAVGATKMSSVLPAILGGVGGAISGVAGSVMAGHGVESMAARVRELEAEQDGSFRRAASLASMRTALAGGQLARSNPIMAGATAGVGGAIAGTQLVPSVLQRVSTIRDNVNRGLGR